MSGGMGYYDGGMYDDDSDPGYGDGQQPVQQQKRNPLRDHLNKVEQQNAELQKQLAALLQENKSQKIASQLQAKGYDPAVASLYGGEPDKLDEWLTSVGPLLAKQPASEGAQGGAGQQGQPPATTVPADGQAAMQAMQQIGNMAAPPAGTDAEQMAQIMNAQDPNALMQYLNGQGNPYHFNG